LAEGKGDGLADNTHPRIADALRAIADIPTTFTADEAIPGAADVGETVQSHVQGIARLGALYYLTHSDAQSTQGLLMLVRDQSILDQIHLPERVLNGHPLNHAGGLQRIGRYLAIPLEPMDEGANGSRVSFWDIGDPLAPIEIEDIAIECPTQKAGSAGIAHVDAEPNHGWYVATCDNGLVSVYESTCFPGEPFVFRFTRRLPHSYESFCLLSDTTGLLYALGFRSDFAGVIRDLMDVFVVDLTAQDLRPVAHRHLITNGVIGEDVHFRWGSGLEIEVDGRLTVMGTKRNFNSIFLEDADRDRLAQPHVDRAIIDRRFHINLFEH
jgi:hypothetical protein